MFALLSLALATDVPIDPAPVAPPTLDGRVYSVSVEDPTQGAKPETFVFAEGTFDARESHQFGFARGPYTVTAREDVLVFTATLKRPTDGEITCTGSISGDQISGAAEWRRPGKNRVHYAYQGAVRK